MKYLGADQVPCLSRKFRQHPKVRVVNHRLRRSNSELNQAEPFCSAERAIMHGLLPPPTEQSLTDETSFYLPCWQQQQNLTYIPYLFQVRAPKDSHTIIPIFSKTSLIFFAKTSPKIINSLQFSDIKYGSTCIRNANTM